VSALYYVSRLCILNMIPLLISVSARLQMSYTNTILRNLALHGHIYRLSTSKNMILSFTFCLLKNETSQVQHIRTSLHFHLLPFFHLTTYSHPRAASLASPLQPHAQKHHSSLMLHVSSYFPPTQPKSPHPSPG